MRAVKRYVCGVFIIPSPDCSLIFMTRSLYQVRLIFMTRIEHTISQNPWILAIFVGKPLSPFLDHLSSKNYLFYILFYLIVLKIPVVLKMLSPVQDFVPIKKKCCMFVTHTFPKEKVCGPRRFRN